MATNCQAIAATTGEQCTNDATDGDFCHIASHNASARTIDAYNGDDDATEKSAEGGDVSVPFSDDQEGWESHGEDMLSLMNRESRDGESVASSAARAVIKKETDGTVDYFRAMFGTCNQDGCNRGCNGFDTDYCGKSDHSPESDDTGESQDDGEQETITVSIDGHEVTGPKSDIMDLLD
jgi:hypothetical protein